MAEHAGSERPDPEEGERDDRLLRPRLGPDEGSAEQEAQGDQAADLGIGPFAELLIGEADQERHQGGDEERGAEVVDVPVGVRVANGRQGAPDDEEHDRADRNVDVEDPLPAEVVGDQAAEAGPEQRAEPEDRTEEALVLAALRWSEDVADDRQRDREQRAGTESLEPSECDELPHLL